MSDESTRKSKNWYCKIPLDLIDNKNITLTDIRVYAALDFLAGKQGWWHGEQEKIFDFLEVRKEKLSVSSPNIFPSRITINRAIQKLRLQGHITTEKMGLKMNNVVRCYIVARNSDPPQGHKKILE